MLNSWGLWIAHKAPLAPWTRKGTDVKTKYIWLCASTQCLDPAGDMATQGKCSESLYKPSWRRKIFGKFCMSQSSNYYYARNTVLVLWSIKKLCHNKFLTLPHWSSAPIMHFSHHSCVIFPNSEKSKVPNPLKNSLLEQASETQL